MHDVPAGHVLGNPVGHLSAEVGEVEVGDPAVEHAGRVVHLAMTHQVNDRRFGHRSRSLQFFTAAAARAAPANAASIWLRASSSIAALTNHASKALGAR